MKRDLVRTGQFKKDFKRRIRTQQDEAALLQVLHLLTAGMPLEPRHRDHPMKGNWSGVRDCHIRPDLLLLYEIRTDLVVLRGSAPTATCLGSPSGFCTSVIADQILFAPGGRPPLS